MRIAWSGTLRRLAANESGGVTVLAALSLPVAIGAAGLVFDLNRGLEQRMHNQRAADMAALGAAIAYRASPQPATLTATAHDIVNVNGVAGAATTAELLENFPSGADRAVRVTVEKKVPWVLARVLGFSGEYTVASQAVASLVTRTQFLPPCFLALSNETDALTLSGGTLLDAPDCSVAAVGSLQASGSGRIRAGNIIAGQGDVTLSGGSSFVADLLRYAGRTKTSGGASLPANRLNSPTSLVDPWANSTELDEARALLGRHAAVPVIPAPVTRGGEDWDFGWSPDGQVAAFRTGSGTYLVPRGVYHIDEFEVGGGVKVQFEAGSRLYIRDGVSIGGGATVNFSDSDLYVNGGFDSGTSGVTIGKGDLWIGSGSVRFKGMNYKGDGNVMIVPQINLGGGQTLLMGKGQHWFGGFNLSGGGSVAMGDGSFVAASGVRISGGSELSVGYGDVTIGSGSGSAAISLSGSAKFFMKDGSFSADGNIETSGGSRIAFGATANHYVNGSMRIGGSAFFGAGRYTINGDLTNGTGGTTWPYTSNLSGLSYGDTVNGESFAGYDLAGADVTFILEGTLNLSGGAKVKLLAPALSRPGSGIRELLIDSLTRSSTAWSGGSNSIFSGAIHLPRSDLSVSGGNSTAGGKHCFTLVASKIKASGGAAAGTLCSFIEENHASNSDDASVRLIG
ncbi:pilus assembly protein TadG-related protein [Croceicoccus sp. F390]|uniref:Pilus assembly protein TadG-related protein n=1 Tax=Croceicoccus esteveae TaxID=3075597 RepID=A0ABU2ZJR2_9SPHN|nr:pilus assembly protein TadG-related protein [Croceicoccus sp. F390]MDT0576838.1 pilus assembly protein TadG-related protein [Croceicoccus sp. F390]